MLPTVCCFLLPPSFVVLNLFEGPLPPPCTRLVGKEYLLSAFFGDFFYIVSYRIFFFPHSATLPFDSCERRFFLVETVLFHGRSPATFFPRLLLGFGPRAELSDSCCHCDVFFFKEYPSDTIFFPDNCLLSFLSVFSSLRVGPATNLRSYRP